MLLTLFLLEGLLILQKVANNIGLYYSVGCNESFLVPGLQNPVFYPVVRFFKNHIFEHYLLQGISGCKNFPGQKESGFRFLPKTQPYSRISNNRDVTIIFFAKKDRPTRSY